MGELIGLVLLVRLAVVVRLPSVPWLCAVFALVLAGSVLRIIENQNVCVGDKRANE